MFNIFLTVFFSTLAFAFVEPYFFIGYLISIALFGLYQAVFMANAGGAWDNAKKIVETELKMKNTPLHAATVVGDTVGDPFKDTSSVALNPVIKFTTLFGLLAVELAVELTADMGTGVSHGLAARLPGVIGGLRLPVVLRDADRVGALTEVLSRHYAGPSEPGPFLLLRFGQSRIVNARSAAGPRHSAEHFRGSRCLTVSSDISCAASGVR